MPEYHITIEIDVDADSDQEASVIGTAFIRNLMRDYVEVKVGSKSFTVYAADLADWVAGRRNF